MKHSQGYKNDIILMVDLGKYFHDKQYQGRHASVDQLPLVDFHGFSLLSWLGESGGVSESDREHIKDVVNVYGEFPVRIKCSGREGKCEDTSTRLVLPYEYVHKHETQSGPEFRKQYDVPPRLFYCPRCLKEFSYAHSAGSLSKGTTSLPINFTIFETAGPEWNFSYCNLDRGRLHNHLKRIAKEILLQGLDIDPGRMDPNARMRVGKDEARDIVKKLLGVIDEQLLLKDTKKNPRREIYKITRTSRKIPGQMKLPFEEND